MRLALGPEMKKRIDEILAGFSTNKDSRESYSAAMLNLDMLRCKDILGISSSKLDCAIDTVQQQYMGTSLRKLEIEAAAPRLSIDAFLKIKGQVACAIGKDISADESNRLTRALCNARTMTLKQETANARDTDRREQIDCRLFEEPDGPCSTQEGSGLRQGGDIRNRKGAVERHGRCQVRAPGLRFQHRRLSAQQKGPRTSCRDAAVQARHRSYLGHPLRSNVLLSRTKRRSWRCWEPSLSYP